MKYVCLICCAIIILCIGSEKAFRAIKKQRINSEPLDKSDGSLVIFGVIVFSGIIALLYGLYYDRNKR